MLKPNYSFACEPARDLVRIHVSGFFSVEDVQAFDAARAFYYGQLRCAPNQHRTLCDASGMKIQTREVVAAFTAVVGDPTYASRKLAVIVGTSLARLQTQRVAERPGFRLFRDAAEAEAWVLAD